MEKKVTLTPIAMRRPNPNFVYAPSKIRPSIQIDQEQFNKNYADNGKSIKVSFEKDGVSSPKLVTHYSVTVGYNKKQMVGRFIIK